jgi:transaldolase
LLHHRILPEHRGKNILPEQLLGKIGIASAKLAYQSYKNIFSGEKWENLVEKGARVQRPLWASTSTKNPEYSDVMYIEPLIGRDTVNTMPDETIEAYSDHGKIAPDTIEKDVDEAKENLLKLEQTGINLDFVTQQLENEGIQKFIEPFDTLMKNLKEKCAEITPKAVTG